MKRKKKNKKDAIFEDPKRSADYLPHTVNIPINLPQEEKLITHFFLSTLDVKNVEINLCKESTSLILNGNKKQVDDAIDIVHKEKTIIETRKITTFTIGEIVKTKIFLDNGEERWLPAVITKCTLPQYTESYDLVLVNPTEALKNNDADLSTLSLSPKNSSTSSGSKQFEQNDSMEMEKKSEEGDYPFSSSQPILPLKYLTNPVLQNVVLNNISSPKSVAHKGSFSSYPSSSVTMEEKSSNASSIYSASSDDPSLKLKDKDENFAVFKMSPHDSPVSNKSNNSVATSTFSSTDKKNSTKSSSIGYFSEKDKMEKISRGDEANNGNPSIVIGTEIGNDVQDNFTNMQIEKEEDYMKHISEQNFENPNHPQFKNNSSEDVEMISENNTTNNTSGLGKRMKVVSSNIGDFFNKTFGRRQPGRGRSRGGPAVRGRGVGPPSRGGRTGIGRGRGVVPPTRGRGAPTTALTPPRVPQHIIAKKLDFHFTVKRKLPKKALPKQHAKLNPCHIKRMGRRKVLQSSFWMDIIDRKLDQNLELTPARCLEIEFYMSQTQSSFKFDGFWYAGKLSDPMIFEVNTKAGTLFYTKEQDGYLQNEIEILDIDMNFINWKDYTLNKYESRANFHIKDHLIWEQKVTGNKLKWTRLTGALQIKSMFWDTELDIPWTVVDHIQRYLGKSTFELQKRGTAKNQKKKAEKSDFFYSLHLGRGIRTGAGILNFRITSDEKILELKNCIMSLDEKRLNDELGLSPELLCPLMPSPIDVRTILTLTREQVKADSIAKLYYVLSCIPNVAQRVKHWKFKLDFLDSMEQIYKNLTLLDDGAKFFDNNESLKLFFAFLLKTCNFVNQERGNLKNAYGFLFDSLMQLHKDLLKYFVRDCENNYPETLEFMKDFDDLCRQGVHYVKLSDVEGMLNGIFAIVNEIGNLMATEEEDDDYKNFENTSDQYLPVMKEFYKDAKFRIEEAKAIYRTVETRYIKLGQAYGSPTSFVADVDGNGSVPCFDMMRNFIKQIKKVQREEQQRRLRKDHQKRRRIYDHKRKLKTQDLRKKRIEFENQNELTSKQRQEMIQKEMKDYGIFWDRVKRKKVRQVEPEKEKPSAFDEILAMRTKLNVSRRKKQKNTIKNISKKFRKESVLVKEIYEKNETKDENEV